MNHELKSPTVLLVNGEYPTHPAPLEILKSANTIICTDGSANLLEQYNQKSQVIIGDMDSINIDKNSFEGLLIQRPEQNTTDIEKALIWSIENDINDLTILGATGLREDHSLGNYFIFCEYSIKLNLTMVTNHFTLSSHKGLKKFDSKKGQIVSIFSTNQNTLVSSTALKHPLHNYILNPSSRAICNESMDDFFSLETNKQIIVFRGHL